MGFGYDRARAYSVLHLIAETAYAAGMARMERDLAQRPIRAIQRYCLLWGQKTEMR